MSKLSSFLAALALLGALGAQAAPAAKLLGDPVAVSQATRTITLGPDTRYVNVTQGEVIRFVTNDKEFAFSFDGADIASFDLQRVAPAGVLDHPVMVYVAPQPDGKDGGRSAR